MGKPFNDPEKPDGAQNQQPTAPPLTDIAHENSYIDFIILGNVSNYSVRADRLSILDSGTELAKLARTEKFTINHGNINPNNFEALVRFIETKFIKFTDDVRNTLNILELASTFQCQDLQTACAKELDLKLAVDNVIDVFKAVRYYSTGPTQISAKSSKPVEAEDFLNALFFNILQFIDQHAADVLIQPDMFTLRFEEFEMIIKRDTLQVPSEPVIFNLLAEWSSKECERKMLEPSEENRRRVLGGLIYSPRYLLMTYDEFKKGRERVNLLDATEIELIDNFFNKKKNSSLTDEEDSMLQNFRKQRPPFADMPINISNRSHPRNYPKKMRKYAQKMANKDQDRGCCDKCILNFCSVFACIFE